MEMSTSQYYQAMANHHHHLEEVLVGCPNPLQSQQQERKPRPHPEQALKCPRCDSTNTKFCYYNNYSLSQPRYFCKGCRRYWTQGGSLRNVPVGGGCRKNKRSPSSSSSSSSNSSKKSQDQPLTTNPNQLLPFLPPVSLPFFDTNTSTRDLTLAFARLHNQPRQSGLIDDRDSYLLASTNPNPATNVPADSSGLLDILRNGFPPTNTVNPSSFYNLCYEFGGSGCMEEEMVLPIDLQRGRLDGGATAASTPTATTSSQDSFKLMDRGEESKAMMGLQWQLAGGGSGNVAVDSVRDFWHGVINDSLL